MTYMFIAPASLGLCPMSTYNIYPFIASLSLGLCLDIHCIIEFGSVSRHSLHY